MTSANKSLQMVEVTKGINSYCLTGGGSTMSYHTRVRMPSYTHSQQTPAMIRGSLMSDLIVYLGSIDFVVSDVDRQLCTRINNHEPRPLS